MSHSTTPLVPQYQREVITNMNNTASPPVHVVQPRPTVAPLLGPENTNCECPFCNASIKTAVLYSSTALTHIAGALWCAAGCMCCIPYCSDSAKNADHYCPSCHRYLGTYRK